MKRLGLFLISGFLLACNESTIDPDLSGVEFDYYPLQTGQYAIYQVEETIYDILNGVESSEYELRVEVVDSFMNQANEITYILHRFTRLQPADPWQFQTAWSSYVTPNQAVLIEENIPFLKITFPLSKNRTWDGNTLNALEEDSYTIKTVSGFYVTPLQEPIEDILTIVQSDNQDTIVQQDRRIESYARNIGLVFKESLLYNYCLETDCIGLQEIESGHYIRQELVSYGHE